MTVRYGFLSTHPPTHCGLATFNSALAAHLDEAGIPGGVVRVATQGTDLAPAAGVVHTWAAATPAGRRETAEVLNTYDIAVILTSLLGATNGGFCGP